MARVDLPALVEKLTGDTGVYRNGRWNFRCPNPAHTDAHASFTVTEMPTTGWRARCWSQCNWWGDALDLLQWLHGYSITDAAKYLRDFTGTPDHYTARAALGGRKALGSRAAPPAPRPLPATERPPATAAAMLLRDYIRRRQWPATVVDHFHLEAVLHGHKVRIRHPYYSATGELVWWQDRTLNDTEKPKWLSPTGVPSVLFNLPALHRDGVRVAIICEGPADTITATVALDYDPTVAVVGVPGATWRADYAPMFKGLTVLIATDADTAGDGFAERIATDLAPKAHRLYRFRPAIGNDLTDAAALAGLPALGAHLRAVWTPSPPPTTPPTVEWVETCAACHVGPIEGGTFCKACAHAETVGRHKWQECTRCSAPALAAPGKACYLTPGCDGTYTPLVNAGHGFRKVAS